MQTLMSVLWVLMPVLRSVVTLTGLTAVSAIQDMLLTLMGAPAMVCVYVSTYCNDTDIHDMIYCMSMHQMVATHGTILSLY